MSSYTTQLRHIVDAFTLEVVEEWFKKWELSDWLTPVQLGVVNLYGLFSKDKLAKHIIDKYYLREIGFETVGEFKRQAEIAMREIMSIQSLILYSSLIQYDPMVNEKYTEIETRDLATTGQQNVNNNDSGLLVNSDTPQGQINKQAILQGKYATSTSANQNEGNSESVGNGTEKGTITRSTEGNRGVLVTQQKLIEQYRDIIVSVENNVILELEQLFMGVY